jgi:hypothetical protein
MIGIEHVSQWTLYCSLITELRNCNLTRYSMSARNYLELLRKDSFNCIMMVLYTGVIG